MSLVEMLASLNACRDGLDFVRCRELMPDSALWFAVEDPTWLMFVLEVVDSVDAVTLFRVTAPLLATWRAAKLDALVTYDAHDGGELVGGNWHDISLLEHETASNAYITALRLAGQKCCAMIRATVAMPTRRQLADAVAVSDERDYLKF